MRKTSEDTLTTAPDACPMGEQPQWRKDFPIDRSQDDLVARRDFTKFLVLTSAALVAGHGWIAVESALRKAEPEPQPLRVVAVDDLPVGGSKVFHYPTAGDPCIVARTGENEFVAYSQLCTHLSCPLLPQPVDGQFHCPCHNGFFDVATGRPTAGPPKRPLPKIAIEVRDGQLWATGVERRYA